MLLIGLSAADAAKPCTLDVEGIALDAAFGEIEGRDTVAVLYREVPEEDLDGDASVTVEEIFIGTSGLMYFTSGMGFRSQTVPGAVSLAILSDLDSCSWETKKLGLEEVHAAVIARDVDGEPGDEWLILRDGGLERVAATGTETYLASPAIVAPVGRFRPESALGVLGGHLATVDGGSVLAWDLNEPGARPRIEETSMLAGRNSAGLTLFTPQMHVLDESRVATVDSSRSSRFSTKVVDISSGQTKEYWSRFAKFAENVDRIQAFTVGGRPAVALQTIRADKISLFMNPLRRVFLLRDDRSRRGHPPVIEFEAGKRFRRNSIAWSDDFDGDKREDVLFAGAGDEVLVIEAWRATSDFTFAKKPRTQKIKADAVGWQIVDYDGDGVRDLVTAGLDSLTVFRGRRAKRGPLFDTKSPARVSFRPMLLDFSAEKRAWQRIEFDRDSRFGVLVEQSLGRSRIHVLTKRHSGPGD